MRKCIRKRLSEIVSLIMLICSLSLQAYADGTAVPDGFSKIAENMNLILYSDLTTGEIAVENKADGYIWRSNPKDRDSDKIARGIQKMNLSSQLLVNCTDTENNSTLSNNYTGSIGEKPPATEEIRDGIRFTFDFPSSQISIPVQYTLCNDYVKAEVLVSRITEYGTNRITDISLLPYFGAGGLNDSGYIFVPDGSGALINFNNGKSYYKMFEEPVYGRDNVLNEMFRKDNKENVKMPVYGIKNGNDAFLAIINEGDFLGTINASVSGWKTSYNNVYCDFRYRAVDSTILAAADYSAKDVSKVESGHAELNSYEVRYYFLAGDDADYSGMAGRYREFLVAEKGFNNNCESDNIPFYLELYGGVKVKKSVFGIPLNLVKPMTTYKQSIDILEKLKEKGVGNIVLRYTGWMNNGINDKLPSKAKLENRLGGKKDFDQLRSFIDDNSRSISLYPDVDFLNVNKTGNGFGKYSDAARDIFDEPALQYKYKVSTFAKDIDQQPWFLTSPNVLLDIVQKYLGSFINLKLKNISIRNMGDMVYSDFNRKKPVDRQQAGEVWEKSLNLAKTKAGNVLMNDADIYSLKDASHVTGIPLGSNGLDIEDESIPFYQMVLHGSIPYSYNAENLCSDQRIQFLKNIETGAYPEYIWTWSDSSGLKESNYNYLYSTKYTLWIDSAVEEYKELNKIFSPLTGMRIVEHKKLGNGVYETVYSNGTRIVVNYNDESYSVISGGN